MRSYERAFLPIAIDDLLTKLARYGWLGVMVCLWRRARGLPDHAQSVFKTALAAGAAVAVLECTHIFMPSRVVSVTEVLLAVIATGAE